MEEYTKIFKTLQNCYPGFNVVKKSDSLLMKTINVILLVITFGMMRDFMTGFATTIGRTVYVSDRWYDMHPLSNAAILRHEGVHMAQESKDGSIVFKLKYLFWIVPFLFAKGRRDYEMEAYEESMRAHAKYFGIDVIEDVEYKEMLISYFTSSKYFWMWPWRKDLEVWYDSTVEKIKRERETEEEEE